MKTTDPEKRILDFSEALLWREDLGKQGDRVVLTNGCFDILHRGHLEYLRLSAELGDTLIVAVNSDASVRALKGPTRPVQHEQDRAFALASLRSVDAVFIFKGPRLTDEIRALKPDLYTKAGDYTPETLESSEASALRDVGAEIQIIPFVQGHSTTSLLERVPHRGL